MKTLRLNELDENTLMTNIHLADVISPNGEDEHAGEYVGFLKYVIDPENGKNPSLGELNNVLNGAINEYCANVTIGELIAKGVINAQDLNQEKIGLVENMTVKEYFEETLSND